MVEAGSDNDVGRGEGRVRVARGVGERPAHVVGPVVVELRRVGRERRVEVGHHGQRLVLDLDQLERVLGDVAAHRDHGRDGLTHPADAVGRKRMGPGDALLGNGEPDHRLLARDRREVPAGDDVEDPGQLTGLADVDTPDACMRHGAAQHGGFDHLGHRHVVDVLPAAREQARILGASDTAPGVLRPHGFNDGHRTYSSSLLNSPCTAKTHDGRETLGCRCEGRWPCRQDSALQRSKDLLRGDRNVVHRPADRVAHRVGDDRGGQQYRALPHSLGAVRAVGVGVPRGKNSTRGTSPASGSR